MRNKLGFSALVSFLNLSLRFSIKATVVGTKPAGGYNTKILRHFVTPPLLKEAIIKSASNPWYRHLFLEKAIN